MKKWEYKAVHTADINFGMSVKRTETTNSELDKLGSEGWELVSVDHARMYFKRPMLNKDESLEKEVD